MSSSMKRWQWWLLVVVNIFFLLVGQAAATLLGRIYYDDGGNSKWLATLVQTGAFPMLFIPLVLFPSSSNSSSIAANAKTSIGTIAFIYLFLAWSLPKLTPYIINSVVLLTFSTALLATQADLDNPAGHSVGKYIIGFVCTLGASATYSLFLSLMQLTFQKVLKKENFSVVLEMQIYTSLVATIVCIIGLFASGEWKTLKGEMEGFKKGRALYHDLDLDCNILADLLCRSCGIDICGAISFLKCDKHFIPGHCSRLRCDHFT